MSWLPRKNVIVPIDFSDHSFAAADEAVGMVDNPRDIRLIHVLPELTVTEPGVVWGQVDDESRRAHAEAALRARLNDNLESATVYVTIGAPGNRIVEYAEETSADLIVLPSHGRTGLPRLLIGSVAERVVRLAHCPVLVLKS